MQQVLFEVRIGRKLDDFTSITTLLAQEAASRRFDTGLLTLWCETPGALLFVTSGCMDLSDQDVADGRAVAKSQVNHSHRERSSGQALVSVPIVQGRLFAGQDQTIGTSAADHMPDGFRLLALYLGDVYPDDLALIFV